MAFRKKNPWGGGPTYPSLMFRYRSRDGGGLTVFARDAKVADAIARAYGRGLRHPFKRRFPFIPKRVRVFFPPYELECEQMRVAQDVSSWRAAE